MRNANRLLSRTVTAALATLCLTLPLATASRAGDLAAFLERAERMATANEKVEADVTIREADGSTRKAHLVIDPAGAGTLVFEEAASGWRSETPLAWEAGKAVTKTGASSSALGPDEPMAASDLRPIDFFPFWKSDYSKAFTSDENTLERTVSLYTIKDRPYTLYVVSFDKAKLVPRMIKFYRDSFNNLVRIRTDKNHVMVGSRPRPTEILVRDFVANTTRTYTLEWKTAEAASR